MVCLHVDWLSCRLTMSAAAQTCHPAESRGRVIYLAFACFACLTARWVTRQIPERVWANVNLSTSQHVCALVVVEFTASDLFRYQQDFSHESTPHVPINCLLLGCGSADSWSLRHSGSLADHPLAVCLKGMHTL
jgi:hypothetical protein